MPLSRCALLLGTLTLLLTPLSAAAQRGGGFRLDPALVDPIVRDGPPTRERLQRLIALSDAEAGAYEAERSAVLRETNAVRDSVLKEAPLTGLPIAGGPRGGTGLDREAQEQISRLRRQRKELAEAQQRLDEWLKKLVGRDRVKPYEEWRVEQRDAAMAGIRQELLRRVREEGGAFGP